MEDFNGNLTEWLAACTAWAAENTNPKPDTGGKAKTATAESVERRRDDDEMMGTWTHDIKFNRYGVDVIEHKIS